MGLLTCPNDFNKMGQSAMVIDCRKPHEFFNHVPNSIFIGLDGGFAPWAGAVIEDLSKRFNCC